MNTDPIQNFTDHDLITRLDTKFTAFTDQYKIDIADLKDNTKKRIDDLETEQKKHTDRLQKTEEWQRDYMSTVKWWRLVAGAIGALMIFLLNWLGPVIRHMLFTK